MTIITEGTIIHGTGRTQDLLRAFAAELDRVRPQNDGMAAAAICDAEELEVAAARGDDEDRSSAEECAMDTLISVMDALNEEAGKHGMYFGAHPGDGSDFGYWQHDEVE